MKLHTLSKDLENVVKKADKHLKFGSFIEAAGDRSFGIILILLSLPSALPLPAAGISTPLGIAIFMVAMQMIFGRESLWLPKKIMKHEVSKKTAGKMVRGLTWILKQAEHIVRPRFIWIHTRPGHIFIGVLVAALSVVMQMPIPMTNTFPAMVIFLLAISLTEDDGVVAVIASVIAVVVIVAYIAGFIAMLFYGFQGLDQFLEYVRSKF
jgi:hypothetical protein